MLQLCWILVVSYHLRHCRSHTASRCLTICKRRTLIVVRSFLSPCYISKQWRNSDVCCCRRFGERIAFCHGSLQSRVVASHLLILFLKGFEQRFQLNGHFLFRQRSAGSIAYHLWQFVVARHNHKALVVAIVKQIVGLAFLLFCVFGRLFAQRNPRVVDTQRCRLLQRYFPCLIVASRCREAHVKC